ncbi:MAG: hypothetical protein CSA50_08655 [Gammaproteobacteria bacterium]|nr:MAG: hypothetical protein CSA50_08655 [Gammaproteobacteria bacterium]
MDTGLKKLIKATRNNGAGLNTAVVWLRHLTCDICFCALPVLATILVPAGSHAKNTPVAQPHSNVSDNALNEHRLDLKPKPVELSRISSIGDWRYTLRPSDSLWVIANDYLKPGITWIELVRYNHIADPNTIAPGTTLRFPFGWLKVQPAPAITISVTGEAMLKKSQASQWLPLSLRQYLRVGDTIKTVNGSVLVRFADDSVLRLDSHTTLVFNRLSQFGKSGMTDTGLRLEKGRVSTRVTPVEENGSRYEISTPSAVAAVRGTEFRLQTDGKRTNLEVTEGRVNLSLPSETLDIPAGYATGTTDNGTLSAAARLPLPPSIKQFVSPIVQLPATIAWNPVNGAKQYQYSLFEGQRYNGNLLIRATTKTPQVTLNHLKNGNYTLTMRAITESGIHGIDDMQRLQVKAHAITATLISPKDGQHATDTPAAFRWQPMDSNVQAKLQVAVDQNFSELVIDSGYSYQHNRSLSISLKPNRYYWRVVTQTGGNSIATSEVRTFTVSGKLEKPKIVSINYTGDRANVIWKTITGAESYTMQLSDKKNFSSLLQEQTTGATEVSIRLNPGMTYYLRLRANGSQYYSPSISDITKISVTY